MKSSTLRLPDDMHDALVAEAASLGISLNTLVRLRLAGARFDNQLATTPVAQPQPKTQQQQQQQQQASTQAQKRFGLLQQLRRRVSVSSSLLIRPCPSPSRLA